MLDLRLMAAGVIMAVFAAIFWTVGTYSFVRGRFVGGLLVLLLASALAVGSITRLT